MENQKLGKNVILLMLIILFTHICLPAKQKNFCSIAKSDDSTSVERQIQLRHTLYLELLGNSGVLSFNYDLMYNQVVSLRVGIGLGLLGMVNGIINLKDHNIELGVGGSYTDGSFGSDGGSLKTNKSWLTGTLAYRYQPQDSHWFIKVGLTPIFQPEHQNSKYPWIKEPALFLWWGGVSIGYSF